MLATLVAKRSEYACNPESETDYICFQSLSMRTKYLTMSKIVLASIFGPYWRLLQAYIYIYSLHIYVVCFEFGIPSIPSPFCDQGCKHIWSQLLLSLQAYLVSVIKIIAVIFGPAL